MSNLLFGKLIQREGNRKDLPFATNDKMRNKHASSIEF